MLLFIVEQKMKKKKKTWPGSVVLFLMRSSPLRLRASDTARRRGHEAGTGDDVTTGLRLWVRLPSSVLPVLRGLGTGQPPAGS